MLFTLTRVARWSLGKSSFKAASTRRSNTLKTSSARAPPSRDRGHQGAPARQVAAPQDSPQPTARGKSRPFTLVERAIPAVPASRETISAAPKKSSGRPPSSRCCCRYIKVR